MVAPLAVDELCTNPIEISFAPSISGSFAKRNRVGGKLPPCTCGLRKWRLLSVNAVDEYANLLNLSDVVGTRFGTEDFCLFLHSFVCINGPKTVVELGTGYGVSAFWMALGAKRNKIGHIWTVDDFEVFHRDKTFVKEIIIRLREANIISLQHSTAEEYYSGISRLFGLDPYLTFVKSTMALNEMGHFNHYPFAGVPIDLLFSDFQHGATAILTLLGQFLPCMAPRSSIFIHSASTAWTSYLLLEQLCSLLNAGKVPKALQEVCSVDLKEFALTRRITLIHLTEWKKKDQNSAAWLNIEPVDVLPLPQSRMRGMNKEITAPEFAKVDAEI